jgi:hypothetical protein
MMVDILFLIVFLYVISVVIVLTYLLWVTGLKLKKYLYDNNRIEDIKILRLADRDSIMITKEMNNYAFIKWLSSIQSDDQALKAILNRYKQIAKHMKYLGLLLVILLATLSYFIYSVN